MKKNKNTVIELFAGAGGLALGLEEAGFNTKYLFEINKWAVETLIKNRPTWNVIESDITKITEVGINKYVKLDSELDLLSGGYPCQSFSYAGKQLGLEDTRGTLFYHYAEFLKELKPKMFLAENVRGLLSHDKGKTLQTMIDVFQEIGYKVQYKILNALDYGVAQKRERIVIIGTRNDIYEKIGMEYKYPEPKKEKLKLKDILIDVPVSEGAKYPEKRKRIFELVPPGGCWRNLPDHIAKEYLGGSYHLGGGKTGIARRLSWDEPSLTLLCTPSQKQTDRCHPDEVRPLTIRESARIQSFPDNWEFQGSMAEKYRQIGNAVPVNLAKEIGISIKEYLNKLEHRGEKHNMKYELDFISDENLFSHVKETVDKYRFNVSLKEFNENLIDPIKLTFDSKVYRKTLEETIESEVIRQKDRSNTNHIGYFHQNIFKYINKDWVVPKQGYDIINEKQNYYVEMKNKHNTMNSSSGQKTYMRMQNTLLNNNLAKCLLVEVIASKSQNIIWKTTLDGISVSNENIRRVSIDKFYEIVTGDKHSFKKLCETLPKVIDDVIESMKEQTIGNTVFSELKELSPNILKSLYLLSFKTYEGFDDLQIEG